jgi:hypothetical protein
MIRGIQGNVDFTVSGADRRRIAQSQIEIHWQSNILRYQFNLVLRDHAPNHICPL